jgi:hypothetical protein
MAPFCAPLTLKEVLRNPADALRYRLARRRAQGERPAPNVRPLCDTAVSGPAHCDILMRTDIAPSGDGRAARVAGYGPADIKSAYNLPDGGAGITVAITEAHDAVTAESDLAVYRNQYGLPPCTTANGCFKKINQRNDSAPSGPGTMVAAARRRHRPRAEEMLRHRASGTTAGTSVVLYDCNGTASQQWQARADRSLYNPNSQLCLDATGGSSQNTTPLELWTCNGLAHQQCGRHRSDPVLVLRQHKPAMDRARLSRDRANPGKRCPAGQAAGTGSAG